MNRASVAGAVLTVAGIWGYGLGVFVEYPGRSYSLTVLMTGIALLAMHRVYGPDEVSR